MSDAPLPPNQLPAADCWFLSGATASGKTRIGIELAQRLGAEIVSLDSMAIYRGMDIGTAKPSPCDQSLVPHHLIDVRDPHEEFSVAEYIAAAHRIIDEIQGRGREVLFVGGTPLYLKGLLRGLAEGPAADWEFRRAVEEEIRTVGTEALFERVRQVDPIAAANLHPNDTRRLIRVLEVYKQTGQPISHHQLHFEEDRPAEACRVFVLRRQREALHDLIERRVNLMLEAGLVEEVQRLTSAGRQLGRTASQAVGYREILELLAGQSSRNEAVEQIKTRTRRFAKRQGTWFRSLGECRFIDLIDQDCPAEIAEQIAKEGKRNQASKPI